jgi:hypothetical protein
MGELSRAAQDFEGILLQTPDDVSSLCGLSALEEMRGNRGNSVKLKLKAESIAPGSCQ